MFVSVEEAALGSWAEAPPDPGGARLHHLQHLLVRPRPRPRRRCCHLCSERTEAAHGAISPVLYGNQRLGWIKDRGNLKLTVRSPQSWWEWGRGSWELRLQLLLRACDLRGGGAMELSTPIGSSLARTAAMTLVSPNLKAGLQITNQMCVRRMRLQCQFSHRLTSVACSMLLNTQPSQRTNHKDCRLLQVKCTENLMQSSVSFSDFSVSVCTEEDGLIKLQVNVSGTMTDSIFEKVFTKNVAAAQPLPGFRQMKGGKTPDIPKEVALHLIGPSKVKKETIKKIINSTVAEYVQKEGLTASKNLKVQQSYEELEAAFEPGKEFCFDTTVHLH